MDARATYPYRESDIAQHVTEDRPQGPPCIGSLLQRCITLSEGQCIHFKIIHNGLENDFFLANLLVTMYAKYGALKDARAEFDKMHVRNVVTWTALITAYARRGHGKGAFQFYRRMQEEGVQPNKVTLISILSACASHAALVEGKGIHACLANRNFQSDVVVSTALANMYGKSGALEDARFVFETMPNRNVIAWNAMITMYAQQEHGKQALDLFQQMGTEGVKPNEVTFINILSACASLADPAEGRIVHTCIVECGFQMDHIVANALVNMYGKCGVPGEARCVFEKMLYHDLVSWNAIITAYAHQAHVKDALELFKHMQQQDVKPDRVTFLSVLGACANLADLAEGKCIHACLVDDGLEADVTIGNALVTMYGKCGALTTAHHMFDNGNSHNLISWTAIIAAYAQQGHAQGVFQLFRQMEQEGVQPDEITFTSLLSACSHAGLVELGWLCFISVEKYYGLMLSVQHYVCMIDLLGRAGLLDEAEDLIFKTKFQHDARLWAALLAACRVHGDTQRGIRAAAQLFNFHTNDTAPYVLLSNMHAAEGRCENVDSIIAILDGMLEL